jgi:hypothetical protein
MNKKDILYTQKDRICLHILMTRRYGFGSFPEELSKILYANEYGLLLIAGTEFFPVRK